MSRIVSYVVALTLPVLTVPAAAQSYGSALTPDDQARLDALRRSQVEQDAKAAAEMKALRAKLLRSAPLPDERDMLLGGWRVESTDAVAAPCGAAHTTVARSATG